MSEQGASQGSPQGAQYQQISPLLQVADWILQSPSMPLELRTQFYALWETTIFGNYNEKDIKFLMSKFREWSIFFKWFIPEQRWGNLITYTDPELPRPITVDINMLLNTLESLYYINLTRGREGFTIKELTTIRSIMRSKYEEEINANKKRGVRLF